jgi:hypothetical protein
MGKNAVTVRAWVLPNAVRSHRPLSDGTSMDDVAEGCVFDHTDHLSHQGRDDLAQRLGKNDMREDARFTQIQRPGRIGLAAGVGQHAYAVHLGHHGGEAHSHREGQHRESVTSIGPPPLSAGVTRPLTSCTR